MPLATRRSVLLLGYWLCFVWFALDRGRVPGYWSRHDVVPYPVVDVAVVCIVMGIFAAILGLVLRPPAGWRLWSRIALRTIYVLLLMLLVLTGLSSDLRGIDYVPSHFGLATLLVLIILSIWLGVTRLIRHLRPGATIT